MLKGLIYLAYIGVAAGFALAFLSQRYWLAQAWKLAGRIRQPGWRKALRGSVIALVALVALIALNTVVITLRDTVSRGSWWTALLGLWLSSSIIAYLCVKVIAAVEWLWRRARPERVLSPSLPATAAAGTSGHSPDDSIDHSRRHFFHVAGVLAGAVPFASALYGFASERLRFEVRQVEIPVANLPAGLDGLRIAQLSDIHVGSYMPVEQVRRAVGMANELGGDLVVVTGDFLTGRSDPLEACIAELSKLRSPLGVWGCNGNHEIYAGAETEAARLFDRFGMKLLRHENAELRWQGSSLNLIGVDYQRGSNGRRVPMLVGVEALVRHDVPNVLLSHNPNSFPRAAELGIELSLAGHTHGGQVRVEILDHRWSPARFFTPYVAGLFQRPLLAPAHLSDEELAALHPATGLQPLTATGLAPPAAPSIKPPESSSVYVNRGLGTIGAPVRLGVPPEITLITLRRA